MHEFMPVNEVHTFLISFSTASDPRHKFYRDESQEHDDVLVHLGSSIVVS